MDDPVFMCMYDLFRKQDTPGQILTYFSGHIIPLCRIDDRIFIGILLIDFFIQMLDQSQYTVIRRIGFAAHLSFVAIAYIFLRHLVTTHLHDTLLHHILDILHINCVRGFLHLLCNLLRNGNNLVFIHLINPVNLMIGRLDRIYNFLQMEVYFFSVSLDHLILHLNSHILHLFISTKYRILVFSHTICSAITIIHQNSRNGKRKFLNFLQPFNRYNIAFVSVSAADGFFVQYF